MGKELLEKAGWIIVYRLGDYSFECVWGVVWDGSCWLRIPLIAGDAFHHIEMLFPFDSQELGIVWVCYMTYSIPLH